MWLETLTKIYFGHKKVKRAKYCKKCGGRLRLLPIEVSEYSELTGEPWKYRAVGICPNDHKSVTTPFFPGKGRCFTTKVYCSSEEV